MEVFFFGHDHALADDRDLGGVGRGGGDDRCGLAGGAPREVGGLAEAQAGAVDAADRGELMAGDGLGVACVLLGVGDPAGQAAQLAVGAQLDQGAGADAADAQCGAAGIAGGFVGARADGAGFADGEVAAGVGVQGPAVGEDRVEVDVADERGWAAEDVEVLAALFGRAGVDEDEDVAADEAEALDDRAGGEALAGALDAGGDGSLDDLGAAGVEEGVALEREGGGVAGGEGAGAGGGPEQGDEAALAVGPHEDGVADGGELEDVGDGVAEGGEREERGAVAGDALVVGRVGEEEAVGDGGSEVRREVGEPGGGGEGGRGGSGRRWGERGSGVGARGGC